MPVTSDERTGGSLRSEVVDSHHPPPAPPPPAGDRRPPPPPPPPRRRRRVIADPRRFAPLVAAAGVALAAGVVIGANHVPAERKAVAAFTAAWERGDQRAMDALLSDDARRRTSPQRLQRTYRDAAELLTLERVTTGPVQGENRVPVTLQTRLFGNLRGTLVVPTGERKDAGPGIDWRAELVYPGLRRGE